MTDGEFEALVDERFDPSREARKGGQKPKPLPDEVLRKLERDGADPRLTKGQARFAATLARCLCVPPSKMSDASVDFIKRFDESARVALKASGHELIED